MSNREYVDASDSGPTGSSNEADKSHRDRIHDLSNDVADAISRGEDKKWQDQGNTPSPPRTGEHPGRDYSDGGANDDIHDGPRRRERDRIERVDR